jgi:predicted DNA-binding helix-hairpin-helix protein
VIGASQENDLTILQLANGFYQNQKLKRVYYSGYIPVSSDNRLPMLNEPPLRRENRLYQADWLMRFYKFSFDEIVSTSFPDLDLNLDPKMAYALRNFHLYPIDINKADYEMLLRVPGLGLKSAKLILQTRRHGRVTVDHLQKMGVVLKRAKYFISNCGTESRFLNLKPEKIQQQLLPSDGNRQLSLF